MKILLSSGLYRARQRGGWAALIVLILICIMAVFVAANTATVNWLRREVKLVDQRETHRLAIGATNQPLSK